MKKTCKYLSFGALAVLIVMMMAATVVEKLRGSAAAFQWFYHSPLFIALWAVAAVAGLAFLFMSGASKRIFTTGLHVSLAVILAGALVTHLFGESGRAHLREGEVAETFVLKDGSETDLPFGVRLDSFDIEYYQFFETPSDYRSAVTFLPDGSAATISMNHIARHRGYRFCQADFDPDEKGSVLMVNHDPWGVGITYAGYIMLLISIFGFFFRKDTEFRKAMKYPGWAVQAVTLAALLSSMYLYYVVNRRLVGNPLAPVLRSSLRPVHILSIVMSYVAFALVAINGIIGLAKRAPEDKEKYRDRSLVVLYPAVFLYASELSWARSGPIFHGEVTGPGILRKPGRS